jgi:hypothetical protein
MGEYIEEIWLPQCLSIGIDYNTFWLLNPKKVKVFTKVFIEKKEEERALINYTSWLTGLYISHSIGACFSKNAKYPDKPFDLTAKEQDSKDDAERFGAWAIAFNHKYEKENEESQ